MKKKYMLMGIAAVLILTTMVGGTLAALNTKSEKAVANIMHGIQKAADL